MNENFNTVSTDTDTVIVPTELDENESNTDALETALTAVATVIITAAAAYGAYKLTTWATKRLNEKAREIMENSEGWVEKEGVFVSTETK